MNTALHAALAGMGDVTTTAIAHTVVGTALTTAATFDPEPISKAILGVAALIQNFFFQPNYNKLATTAIVQKAETLLRQNLAAWEGLSPGEKTPAAQAAALQNFDTTWTQVVTSCESGQYGSPGQACVQDRQAGGCHYQVAPGAGCTSSEPTCWVQNSDGTWSLSGNGPAGSGSACWNWFVGYRDPIANDPQVAANVSGTASPAGATTQASSSAGGAVFGIDPTLLLIGGGLLLAFVLAEAA